MSVDWATAADPYRLLAVLRRHGVSRRRGGRRKLRLVGCAAARLVWDRLPDDRLRAVVLAAERHADTEIRRVALSTTYLAAARRESDSVAEILSDAYQGILSFFGAASAGYTARTASVHVVEQLSRPGFGLARAAAVCRSVVTLAVTATGDRENPSVQQSAELALADRVRDLFGEPGVPVEIAPGWRTAAVLGLARAAHQDGAFDRLPILADALEEAGCDLQPLLEHCRSDGPHSRGCWAVDALLGRPFW